MSSRAAEAVECSTCGEREEGHPDWLGHTFWIEVEVTETTAQAELRAKVRSIFFDQTVDPADAEPIPMAVERAVDALMEVVGPMESALTDIVREGVVFDAKGVQSRRNYERAIRGLREARGDD